jgi:hypothetical protein
MEVTGYSELWHITSQKTVTLICIAARIWNFCPVSLHVFHQFYRQLVT